MGEEVKNPRFQQAEKPQQLGKLQKLTPQQLAQYKELNPRAQKLFLESLAGGKKTSREDVSTKPI
jgi:hypothetical protein